MRKDVRSLTLIDLQELDSAILLLRLEVAKSARIKRSFSRKNCRKC
uniref:Uncharacterized protein n=1 Tax=Nelumbo nucifera TaxID=4432 RepID=A0A822Z2F7_NELNU|nr:TPA_asm: hypothetical protein HUJ06_013192 [Nelumbo nucifera]